MSTNESKADEAVELSVSKETRMRHQNTMLDLEAVRAENSASLKRANLVISEI